MPRRGRVVVGQNDPITARQAGVDRLEPVRPPPGLTHRPPATVHGRTDGRNNPGPGRTATSDHVRAAYCIGVVCTYVRYSVCMLLLYPRWRTVRRACVLWEDGLQILAVEAESRACTRQTDHGRCVGLGRSIGKAKRQSRHAAASSSLSLVKKDWTSVQEQYAHVIGCRFHLHQASRLLRATPLSAGLAHSKLLQCASVPAIPFQQLQTLVVVRLRHCTVLEYACT